MKLLAVGDQHLGAGADLGRKPGDRLAEQEAVWKWTLAQAREHEVDAILHAGDVFQHRKPDPETMLAFERPLVDHIEDYGGPKPLVIVGNHCISSLDGACALDVFEEAGLIDLVREPRVVPVGGARVVCLPWAPTSRLAANYDGPRDLLNQHAAALLIEIARALHDEALAESGTPEQNPGNTDPGSASASPIILLTHFSISGTSLPSGLDVGQLPGPVLPQEELLAIGYDAVIAGHIHRRQVFSDDPFAAYVGSSVPLSFGELGDDYGPLLLEWSA